MRDLWYMQAGVTTAGRPKGGLAWQLRWIDVLLMTACLCNGRCNKRQTLLGWLFVWSQPECGTHTNVFVPLPQHQSMEAHIQQPNNMLVMMTKKKFSGWKICEHVWQRCCGFQDSSTIKKSWTFQSAFFFANAGCNNHLTLQTDNSANSPMTTAEANSCFHHQVICW